MAEKHNKGKIELDLISPGFLMDIGLVLTVSAKCEYDRWNWTKGRYFSEVYASVMRHLVAWYAGQDLDPKTKANHLAHACCQIMFLLEFQRAGREELDDRRGILPASVKKA